MLPESLIRKVDGGTVPREKKNSLQVFRALAALGVVMHHTALSTSAFVGSIPVWLNSAFAYGFLGVDFFFVLSGFIIMSSHFDDPKSFDALKKYGGKRLLRIFPPYWPVSILLIVSYLLLPGLSQGNRGEFSYLSSLLLLPDHAPPALSVAWTLMHELMFYMIFCLYFVSNRLFVALVAVWMAAIAGAAWQSGGVEFSPLSARLVHPLNLEFMMGMAVACIARLISVRYALFIVSAGLVIFVGLLRQPLHEEARILFGFPFSAFVLAAVLLEQSIGLMFSRWLVLMGDASYSIYLIHNPLVSLTGRLLGRFNGYWGAGMLLGIASSVLLGIGYHYYVEKPLIGLLRGRFKRFGMA